MTHMETRLKEPPLTARELGTDRLQALQELIETLAQFASEDALFHQALGILQSTLDLPCASILILDPSQRMRFRAWCGFTDVFLEAMDGCCPWPVELPNPQPVIVEDIQQEPVLAPCLTGLLAEGIQSLAFIPLLSQKRLFGEILLCSRLKRYLNPEETRFAVAVANLMGFPAARNQQAIPDALSSSLNVAELRKSTVSLQASEDRFFKIFHLSPDAIDLTQMYDGISMDCNSSYAKLYGYSREEILGHSTLPGDLGVWVHKEDRDRHIAELRAGGEVFDFEAPLRRKDGSTFIGLISSSMLEINGQPCNLTLTRDITERKRADEALRESTQRLQLALASGNLGIWDWNLLEDTEIWDDRMYELYGLERSAIVPNYGTWAERILHPDDVPRIQGTMRTALAGEHPYDLKFRIVRPDGTVRHIGSNGIVIRDVEGKAARVIGINRDRTEQVEAEAERRRLQAEVHHAEKLESIGSLAGGVAHDMNNVLTAILITAEMLHGNFEEDDPMAKSLAVILHAGQRGRDLVKALTDFARKGLGEASSIDLNDVLRKEVELLRHTTLKKIQVVLDLDEKLPAIRGAASELGSALMNLSVNALDAMPEGGTLTFRSRALPQEGRIELTVTDTGQGMTPEVLARAMEPFFTTKPAGKGTGLGLARVYGTLRAHGGTVEVQSQAGQGTRVILRLPASPGNSQDGSPAGNPILEASDASLRILLVDDEDIILETIPTMLKSLGHLVETASHGEETLRRLDLCPVFDLVILDHNMPGLTGVETLIQLRRKCPGLPVILSSGFMDAKTEDLLASIPQVWVLKKPYDMHEIQRTLSKISRIEVQ